VATNHRIKAFAAELREEFPHFKKLLSRIQMWISSLCLKAAINPMRHKRYPSAIAIPNSARKKFFPTAKEFEDAYKGILEAGSNYSISRKECRPYWLDPYVMGMVDEHLKQEHLKQSPLEDHNGVSLSEPGNAIRSKDASGQSRKTDGQLASSVVLIDKDAVLKLYSDLGCSRLEVADSTGASLQVDLELDSIDRTRRQCLAVVDQATVEGLPENGILQTYHEADSGRIIGDGIHLQNINRMIREAALNGQYDHDIEACHAALLLGLADQYGFKAETLSWYVDNKQAFRRYLSDEYDLDIEEVKQALTAITYGAPLSSSGFTVIGRDILHEQAGDFVNDPELKALNFEIKQIAGLVESQAPRSRCRVINVLGKGIPETEGKYTKVAHILHGLETIALMFAIEHTGGNITLLCHDGFVTKEPIDTEQIAESFYEKTGIIIRYSTEIISFKKAS